MTFSEKLTRLRKREGISQEELAQYLSVSRQAVSRWEQGTAMPDAENLRKLRKRFCVTIDWLLEDEQEWEQRGEPAVLTHEKIPALQSQPLTQKSVLPWALPLGLSSLGLLVLGIFCSLHPGTYETAVAAPFGTAVSRVYTGLFGSLKCYRLEWLFWLCAVIAAGSLAAGVWQKFSAEKGSGEEVPQNEE